MRDFNKFSPYFRKNLNQKLSKHDNKALLNSCKAQNTLFHKSVSNPSIQKRKKFLRSLYVFSVLWQSIIDIVNCFIVIIGTEFPPYLCGWNFTCLHRWHYSRLLFAFRAMNNWCDFNATMKLIDNKKCDWKVWEFSVCKQKVTIFYCSTIIQNEK